MGDVLDTIIESYSNLPKGGKTAVQATGAGLVGAILFPGFLIPAAIVGVGYAAIKNYATKDKE